MEKRAWKFNEHESPTQQMQTRSQVEFVTRDVVVWIRVQWGHLELRQEGNFMQVWHHGHARSNTCDPKPMMVASFNDNCFAVHNHAYPLEVQTFDRWIVSPIGEVE